MGKGGRSRVYPCYFVGKPYGQWGKVVGFFEVAGFPGEIRIYIHPPIHTYNKATLCGQFPRRKRAFLVRFESIEMRVKGGELYVGKATSPFGPDFGGQRLEGATFQVGRTAQGVPHSLPPTTSRKFQGIP